MPSIFSSQFHDVISLQKLKSVFCSATLLASIVLNSGCASNRHQDFSGSTTRFELIRFFTAIAVHVEFLRTLPDNHNVISRAILMGRQPPTTSLA
jgi:hypothetical protein